MAPEPTRQKQTWSNTTKLVVLLILLGIGGWVLVRFSEALPPFIIAMLLAYILTPPTNWIVRRTGLPRGMAVGLVYLILLLVIILIPILISPSIASIFSSVQFDMEALNQLATNLENMYIVIGPLQLQVGELAVQSAEGLQTLLSSVGSQALISLLNVLSNLFWVAFVVVVTFWLIKDSHKLGNWLYEHIPQSQRRDVSKLLEELNLIWGSFFKGTIVLAIIVGTMVGLAMWVLGVQHVLLLAIFAGFMEFIPSLGPFLGAVLAVVVALLGGSSWLPLENWMVALIVLVVYTLIFQFEQVYLYPRVVGRRVNLHPGIVFVGAILGAVEFGLLGVMLAAPVLASARVLARYFLRRLTDQEPFPEEVEATPDAIRWRGMMRGQPVAAIFFDLDGTLAETDELVIQAVMRRLQWLNRLFPNNDAELYVRRWVMRLEPVAAWFLARLDDVDLDQDALKMARRIRKLLGYRKSDELALVVGADDALRSLRMHYPLALVTTRDRHSTERFLRRFGLTPLFDVIITGTDVRRLKPHPEPVLKAAEALGVEPDQCVMVGDTLADIRAARAAGAASVGVLTGFGAREDLDEADIVLNSVAELPQWL